MDTDTILLALLCSPCVLSLIIIVLIETYDKIMEIILSTLAFIVAVWEWRKKKTSKAMREINK